MIRKKNRRVSLEKLKLTNPQKEAVASMLTALKNKYKKHLHETHERLHIIADNTAALEFWVNVLGHFEYMSPSSDQITGYPAADYLEKRRLLEHLIHPDSLEQFRKDKEAAFAGGAGTDIEYKFIRRDGEIRWARAAWKPVKTRRGRLIGIRGSIIDITELKQARTDSLGASPEVQQALMLLGVNESGTISRWSETARRLTGYFPKEIIGKPLETIFDKPRSEWKRISLSGTAAWEVVCMCKDGTRQTVRIEMDTVTNGKGVGESILIVNFQIG